MTDRTDDPKPVIAFLGLGAMGAAMARNLLDSGFEVRLWNRSPEKAEALAAAGGSAFASPADAVAEAEVVLSSLYDPAAVREVAVLALPGMRPGTIWAEMSTLGIGDVGPLAALAGQRDVTFVDAPVQGARPLAEKGELLVYAAGPASSRATLEPIFEVLGRRLDWLDETAGGTAASALKLVVNNWVFALTTASGEAMALAEGLGVGPEHFLEAIAGGPLDNGWAQAKAGAIVERDFAALYPLSAAAKDAELILAAAASAGVRIDQADAVRERFARAAAQGHAGEDMSASYWASFATE